MTTEDVIERLGLERVFTVVESPHALGPVTAGMVLAATLSTVLAGALPLGDRGGTTQPADKSPGSIARLIVQLGDESFRNREQAQQALVAIGRPALPLLKAATTDGDAERASRAGQTMRAILDRPLLQLMADHGRAAPVGSPHLDKADIRAAWVKALGELGDPRAMEYILGRLADPDETVRLQAAAALREMTGEMYAVDPKRWRQWWEGVRQPTETPRQLLALLDDPRLEVRRRAIWKLGQLRDPASLDGLLERFVNRKGGAGRGPEVYPDRPRYRQDFPHLKTALMMLGEQAVDKLIPVAGYGWSIREDATEMLVRIGPAATPALIEALGGRKHEANDGAAAVLGRTRPLEAVIPLVRASKNFQGNAHHAFDALTGYDEAGLPLLRQAFADPTMNDTSRQAAAIMLLHLGDECGRPLLLNVVTRGSAYDMQHNVSRFGTTKNPLFLPLIEKALARKDVVQGVVYAAAFCGGKDALPMIEKLKDHPDPGVRYGVKVWVDRLSRDNDQREAETRRELEKLMKRTGKRP